MVQVTTVFKEVPFGEISGDLDDIPDGTIYARVESTTLDGNRVALLQADGDLDDVDDGISYVKTTPSEKSGAGYAFLGLNDSGEPIFIRAGTSFPGSPQTDEQFLRTDEGKYYRYTGATWDLIAADNLVNIEGDLDGIIDGTTYKKVTANEKTGAGYAYIGFNAQGEPLYIRSGTSFPGSPATGMQFLRTDEDKFYRYNGATWDLIAAADLQDMEGDLDGITDGTTYKKTTEDEKTGAGYAYLGLNSSGEPLYIRSGTSFPGSPATGMQFYRTDEEKFYRYNGASWDMISAANLSNMEGDLDGIIDGSTYAKVTAATLDGNDVALGSATGDLDDVSDGSSYAKVSSTVLTGGEINAVLPDAVVIQISDEDLELYMPFNEGFSDECDDRSGNDNDGSFGSAISWVTTGKFGKCVAGTGALSNSNIDLGADIVLTGAFSISCWIYWDDFSDEAGICGDDADYANGRISVQSSTSINVTTASGNTNITVTALPTTTWCHLVITRNGSNLVTIYKDTVSIGSGTQAGNITVRRLMDNPDNSGWGSHDGMIDEFHLWSRLITSTEIMGLYRVGANIPGNKDIAIFRTADKDQLTASEWEGKLLYDTGEKKHYTSDGTNWLVVNLSDSDVWTYSNRQYTYVPGLESWFGGGDDGNHTLTGAENLGDSSIKFYNDLNLAGFTLSGNSPMIIFVAGTLTLASGTISVNYESAGGAFGAGGHTGDGGPGGDGGGMLFVIAKTISGTGTFSANGENGTVGENGTDGAPSGNQPGSDGSSGASAECLDTTYTAAGGGIGATDGTGPAGGSAGTVIAIKKFKEWLMTNLSDISMVTTAAKSYGSGGSGGGGGGSEQCSNGTGQASGGGGGGGGSLFKAGGAGGQGGDGTGQDDEEGGGGGGGGGAGGIVVVIAEASPTTLTITCTGGNGGNGGDAGGGGGADDAGGGGGGGAGSGGFAVVIADNEPATITLSAGSVGTGGAANGVGDAGSNGNTGTVGGKLYLTVDKFRTAVPYTP